MGRNESQPPRPEKLPVKYHAGFNKSAKDFTYYFYVRGSSDTGSVDPTDYCGVTSVTADDDKPIGFFAKDLEAQADGMKNHVSSLTNIIKGDTK
jgi:hypothetical protein